MVQFERKKILPLFLQRQETITSLARRAGVNHRTAQKAINGERVGEVYAARVARALNVADEDISNFIYDPRKDDET